MAVFKQLKTKIDGKTTDIYPYTSPDAVLNSDGTTLQDTLDNLSDSVNNAVSDIKVDWNETDKSSVNYIHNKPDLDEKANVDSPTLTGTPIAPTATAGTNTDQIATTAFVQNAVKDATDGLSIDTNTTYTLTKSGSIITLTGSDGSTTAVEDDDTNTTYSKLSEFINDSGYITGITKDMIIDALGYEPGTSSSEPDGNTTYTLTKSGSTITLTGSDGSTTSVEDDNTDTNTIYTHPTYTERIGVPTTNQTPVFGGTFDITQPVSDATGHVTAMNSRTITIPNAEATTSSSGLMSAKDKKLLGTKDISSIGDGTITGAIVYLSELSADLSAIADTLDDINRVEV